MIYTFVKIYNWKRCDDLYSIYSHVRDLAALMQPNLQPQNDLDKIFVHPRVICQGNKQTRLIIKLSKKVSIVGEWNNKCLSISHQYSESSNI